MVQNSILLFIDGNGEPQAVENVQAEQTAADQQQTVVTVGDKSQAPQPKKPEQGGGGSPWMMIIMMVLIFAVFYFFMIRPQRKQQKELQKKRDAMKKGDRVVTAGGIYGEIKEVQDNTFIITIAKDVTIKVNRESVYADASAATQAASDEKK